MELVILCGLQGSGKSTFRRERLAAYSVVSKDLMRNARRKETRQRRQIAEHLAAGRSVVVDNVNPAPEDRMGLTAIGRELGARVTGYYFEVPFELCVERNAARSPAEVVPWVGLVHARRRFRRPAIEEGFDALWIVKPAPGGFEVAVMEGSPVDG